MPFLHSSALSRRASSAADRALKAQQQRKYVKELWLFLAAVIALLAVIRVLRFLFSLTFKPLRTERESQQEKRASAETPWPGRHGRVFWRRFPGACATAFRTVAFRWTIPIGPSSVASVSELTFIIGYIVAIFIWLLVDTRDLTTMFWEDRAAHFASSNLALVVALAGKNNIISFLTGIGHEKLNILHRAAARTCLILLWMHAVAHTALGLPEVFDFSHNWMRAGAVGLAAFTLATILSVRPIRQLAFEFFLASHIILIAVFLIAGVVHTRAVRFDDYIWPALVIWALDRAVRLVRVIWNSKIWRGRKTCTSRATMVLLSEDTVRLTFCRSFDWKPGQHAYIILPTISASPTEAHPFTISNIPRKMDGTVAEKEENVVFIIRGRGGFTRRLREHAAQNGICDVPAFIDGPYGCPPDLRRYSTCILIAGGSGVSYTLPLFMESIRMAKMKASSTERVVFIWAVRDAGHLSWISTLLTEALSAAPPWLAVEPRIYVTRVSGPTSDTTLQQPNESSSSVPTLESGAQGQPPKLPVYTALKVIHGRPSIRRLLQDEISTSKGPVSVDVAGPSAIARSVRTALRSVSSPAEVLKGMPPVTLHVETFGMVKG